MGTRLRRSKKKKARAFTHKYFAPDVELFLNELSLAGMSYAFAIRLTVRHETGPPIQLEFRHPNPRLGQPRWLVWGGVRGRWKSECRTRTYKSWGGARRRILELCKER